MMSTITPAVTEPAVAARAGADLREARERLGLSLDDIASNLRIRMPHLEALEEGHISLLPGNAYAMAFVRTYANALGLDAEEMVRRFRTEAGEFGRRTELVFPVPMPERGLPAGAVLLLGLVLAIGAYAGWYRLSSEGRLPAETATAIPERLAPLAEQSLPPPPGAPPLLGAPTSGGPKPSAIAQVPGSAVPRVVRADPVTSEMLDKPAQRLTSPTSAAAAQLPSHPGDPSMVAGLSTGAAPATPPAAGLDANRVVLRAGADAWVMVKDRAGAVLLNRTMKAGETWPVPPRSDLLLSTGNAGGTDVLLDGVTTPSLGASGAVRRDLPLDPDQIKEGRLGGTTAPQLASTRPRQ